MEGRSKARKGARRYKTSSQVQVYFFDLQHNNLYHRQFWASLKYGYDIFGLFYIDSRKVREEERRKREDPNHTNRPLDEAGKVSGNPDEANLLDSRVEFVISDFDYFVKLYETLE